LAYKELDSSPFTQLKYYQPLELVLFHFIIIRIKCLKGSYYPHLLNNYLINYLNLLGLTAKKKIRPLPIGYPLKKYPRVPVDTRYPQIFKKNIL